MEMWSGGVDLPFPPVTSYQSDMPTFLPGFRESQPKTPSCVIGMLGVLDPSLNPKISLRGAAKPLRYVGKKIHVSG